MKVVAVVPLPPNLVHVSSQLQLKIEGKETYIPPIHSSASSESVKGRPRYPSSPFSTLLRNGVSVPVSLHDLTISTANCDGG